MLCSFSLDETPDLSGKVAIVTGGSEGIGYGATRTFLKHGIKQLFVISENKEVADGANKALAQELGQDAADRTTWLHLDLSDWAAIPKVAEQITSKTDRIDILFNNAGRGIMSYELTGLWRGSSHGSGESAAGSFSHNHRMAGR